MAKNDVVLIDGILDERSLEPQGLTGRDEIFESFAIEQLLKNYDLSREEMESGWTDGSGDGGIDGFYIFINGNLLADADTFAWPRASVSIEVWLFTCKLHSTFQQAPLDAMIATVAEIFDLSIDKSQFKGLYSAEILRQRALFSLSYKKLSITRPALIFNIVYASRGNTDQIGESVAARANQISSTFPSLFSSCEPKFHFIGASELVVLHRRIKKFSLDLNFVEHLATGKESYVLLVRLDEYCRFVTDENGNLRRYLFDSNVRDFLGENRVNEDISESLADDTGPDFWWLNNGVTILATNATAPGKTIELQDIQIVNGLQTTESIFRHFQSNAKKSGDRCLLVKIVVSTDPLVRDQIIRATNNQSLVELAALHATDKIQRDIEEILEKNSWFYERRKNYYVNLGKPKAQMVTPIYLASAVVALIFKHPSKASNLKSRFMRNAISYAAIFSEKLPLTVWPTLVGVYKAVDQGLEQVISSRHATGERFIRNWRPLISLIAVARLMGTYAYGVNALVTADPKAITREFVDEIWDLILESSSHRANAHFVKVDIVRNCCELAAKKFNLIGIEDVGVRQVPSEGLSDAKRRSVSKEFLETVNLLLPDQPWKPGIQFEIADKLNAKPAKIQIAIKLLIERGLRHKQHDGIVYGADGSILASDPERVPLSAVPPIV